MPSSRGAEPARGTSRPGSRGAPAGTQTSMSSIGWYGAEPAGGHDLADGGTDALVVEPPPVRLAVPDVDVAQPAAEADDKVNHQPFRRGAAGGGTDLGTDLGIVTFVNWHVPGERVAHVTLPTFGYNLSY